MIRTLVAALVLVAAGALGSAAPQAGDRPNTASTEEADFTGKILIVKVKEPAQGGTLQRARVKRIGGRAFMVGDSVKRSDDDEEQEATYWFPVEDIQLIWEYKSVEDARKAYDARQKAKK